MVFFLCSFQVVQETWKVENLYFVNYYQGKLWGISLKILEVYKNYNFYQYFPKISKKSTLRLKKSTKKAQQKQLVKKKHKKAHVLFKNTSYEHCFWEEHEVAHWKNFLVYMPTQWRCPLSHPFPMDRTEMVISQLLVKIELWCLVHMKGLWKHFQDFIIRLLGNHKYRKVKNQEITILSQLLKSNNGFQSLNTTLMQSSLKIISKISNWSL